MITSLRRGAKSPLFLVILAIIAVAFVVTGINAPGSVGGGLGAEDVASVDGRGVTVREVTDQAERRLAQARQQNSEADMAQLVAAGAIEQIIDGLITQRAVRLFADDSGMAVGKAQIDGQIASMPAFFDLTGKFSDAAYRSKLAEERVSEAELREDVYATTLQRQLLIPIGASARVPSGVAAPYATMLLENRRGMVGIVPAQSGGPEPSEADLAAFYAQNRARYLIPERRVVRYALLGAADAGASAPTEAEIADYYRANAATYAGTETRVLSQVVLPDQAAARAMSARIAGGQSFVAAAAAAGFSAGDISIGPQDKAAFARLTSQGVADRVFTLGELAVSAPLQSPLGWHVVKVDAVRRAAGRPLATVRGEIASELGKRKADEAMAALIEAVEEQISDGASFADVARARKLSVVETPPITASGIAPGNPGYRPPASLAPLLKSAFESAPGEDPLVEALPGETGYAIVAVERVVPAAPPPLANVRAEVVTALKAKRASDRARAIAAAIVAKVNGGAPMARAFAEAGIRVGAPRPITARRLDVARANQQIPPPLQMLFSLPKGRARLLAAPQDAGFFVVHLTEIVPGDPAGSPGLTEATRNQFSSVAGQEYVEQFVNALRKDRKIVRDERAIARLKSQLDGTAARSR